MHRDRAGLAASEYFGAFRGVANTSIVSKKMQKGLQKNKFFAD
jgi:hypothetical protein